MTTITDLEMRIEGAEDALTFVKDQLAGLKTHLQELKEKQDKQPEPEKEDLFGRWATHPEHGRGIIVSCKPDGDGDVRFACLNGSYTDGVDTRFVLPESLDPDPATLTTEQDFESAPEGTIVEGTTGLHDVYLKCQSYWLVAGDIEEANPTTFPPCRVIRWGNGK